MRFSLSCLSWYVLRIVVGGAVIGLLWASMNWIGGYLPDYLAIGLTWMVAMVMIMAIMAVMARPGVAPFRDKIWGWVSFGLFFAGVFCEVYWLGTHSPGWPRWSNFLSDRWDWIGMG